MRIIPAIANAFLKPPVALASNLQTFSVSTTAYATKGIKFTALRNYLCYGVLGHIITDTGGATATYRGYLLTKSGNNIGAFLRKSPLWTPRSLSTQHTGINFLFESPAFLVAGGTYDILVGRTDGADNFALPIKTSSSPFGLPMACRDIGASEYLAKANPAVGDAITAGSTSMFAVYPIVQLVK